MAVQQRLSINLT